MIDATDREIMNFARTDEISNIAHTAQKLPVSPSSIKYRLDKLRMSGVISEEAYFIRPTMKIFQAQLVVNRRTRTRDIDNSIVST